MKLLSALLFSAIAIAAQAETITGRVVSITDGDTIVVLDADHRQHNIRLAGIYAQSATSRSAPARPRTSRG